MESLGPCLWLKTLATNVERIGLFLPQRRGGAENSLRGGVAVVFSTFVRSLPTDFMSTEAQPVRIFIAYSSKDLIFKDGIRKSLRPLERAKKVSIWDNYDIEAGKIWDAEVREKLAQSDLILLLLSPDALDSDYFYDVEARIALERHEAGEAIAVGILLRPCIDMLKHTPLNDFTKYELLPKKGLPVTDRHWRTFDDAYLTIFREVDVLVEKIEAKHYKKCSACGGSGNRTISVRDSLKYVVSSKVSCSECDGTGKIKRT